MVKKISDADLAEAMADLLARYESALHQAMVAGETTMGTYEIRTYNADRFVRFAKTGRLSIRGVQKR